MKASNSISFSEAVFRLENDVDLSEGSAVLLTVHPCETNFHLEQQDSRRRRILAIPSAKKTSDMLGTVHSILFVASS